MPSMPADPTANIPLDVIAATEETCGLPILEAVEKYRYLVAPNTPPDVVAAIEEQCGMPFLEAVENMAVRRFCAMTAAMLPSRTRPAADASTLLRWPRCTGC